MVWAAAHNRAHVRCRLLDVAGMAPGELGPFGGLPRSLRIGLFSFWINTYVGSGSSRPWAERSCWGFPRFMRLMRLRDGIVLAIGIFIVAVTRPYEGIFLCVPVAFTLGTLDACRQR